MISTNNICYIAGFLDGEGWFGWSKQGGPIITASQNTKEPLIDIHSLLHGSMNYQVNNKTVNGGYWWWSISGGQAVGIMMTLYTLLTPRRQAQIKVALDKWRTSNRPFKIYNKR